MSQRSYPQITQITQIARGDLIRLKVWPCQTCKSAIGRGAFIPCTKAMQLVLGRWLESRHALTVEQVTPVGELRVHGVTCLFDPEDVEFAVAAGPIADTDSEIGSKSARAQRSRSMTARSRGRPA